MGKYLTKRQRLEQRRGELEIDRQSFMSDWRELIDYFSPHRGRFSLSETNRGGRRNQNIIDTTPSLAVRIFVSGMMSGVTSRARPWFRLTTSDPDLAEFGPVKEYLHIVNQRMLGIFIRSNLYNTLPIIYGHLAVPGTSAMFVEEDFDNVIHCYAIPIGSYSLASDRKGRVNTYVRVFRMTVWQLVNTFAMDQKTREIDWERLSTTVKHLWDNCQYNSWIDVCHSIGPNDDWNPNKLGPQYKRYSSDWYEIGSSKYASDYRRDINDRFLRESGFDQFPVLCPRWSVNGEDVYATDSPALTALGDNKQLQKGEKNSLQAIDKMVKPPMMGPSSLRRQKCSLLPGDMTWLDSRQDQLKPIIDTSRFRVDLLEGKQEQVRSRIEDAMYVPLFTAIINVDKSNVTAEEIARRYEEKLLLLGPALGQIDQDLSDPLIDLTYGHMQKQNLLPSLEETPEELQGQELKVEYISIVHQAQKIAGIQTVERTIGFVGQVAQFNPEALDKIDVDNLIDVYSDMASIPPGIIRSNEDVQEIRQLRAQQAQAAQAIEAANMNAKTAKDLSQAKLSGDSALDAVAQEIGAA